MSCVEPAISSVHVVADLDAEASGPTHSVTGFARGLVRAGAPACTFSLSAHEGVVDLDGLPMHRFAPDRAPVLRALGASAALRRGLRAAPADVFHIHGLWRMANIYPAGAAVGRGAKLFLSPHGMLGAQALRFSSWRKKFFWALAQGRVARRADAFHATSEQEWRDIRAYGLRQPVVLLPNGVDLRPVEAPADPPYVLSLGRLHPIKGLDRLLRAWALLEPEFPE